MKEERKKISVAIQGVRGSFHEMAAVEYFRENEVVAVPFDTFSELFNALTKGQADFGVVAFENSVAGSILPNYELLRRSRLPVTGEIFLRIKQNLVALPGQHLSDIKEIHSHPMALQQCSQFIDEMRQQGVKIVEAVDTALSARIISEERQYGAGAIASSCAADIYSLEVLKPEIEDDSMNFTRFLIVAGNRGKIGESTDPGMPGHHELSLSNLGVRGGAGNSPELTDKAMVCFSLPHKVGSLSQVLSVLAFYQVSLTRIQSLPIVGRPWEYMFHIDVIYDDYARYRMALDAIRPLTEGLEIVAEYRCGLMSFDPSNN